MSEQVLHNIENEPIIYVSVLLPLAVKTNYTFKVPEDLQHSVQFGIRVEVPLRNKIYAGLVIECMGESYQPGFTLKYIHTVLDQHPIITRTQYDLWKWIASYYMCTEGEVMSVALPTGLKMSSETLISAADTEYSAHLSLSDDEFMIMEALQMQQEIPVKTIQDILDKKSVYPVLKKLFDKQLIKSREELAEAYKPKLEQWARFSAAYADGESGYERALEKTVRSFHQANVVQFLFGSGEEKGFPSGHICKETGADASVLSALEKKGILEKYYVEISRLKPFDGVIEELPALSSVQEQTTNQIRTGFEDKPHALLHGVTGSGKTRIYQELISEAVASGGQVLYLLPEIALTSHIVQRLQKNFGDDVLVFHSKLSVFKRVEIWNKCLGGHPVLIGARSALFLPFTSLKLIIVDEEHDPSFKQYSPNPRYNARDVAAYMAHKLNARIIYGSATPALETWYNAQKGLYQYVGLNSRFGTVKLPEIEIINMHDKSMLLPNHASYSIRLISQIQHVLSRGDQVLLFQNRRGFAPTIRCGSCGWYSKCQHCDVSMTYHKVFEEIRCHYCHARSPLPGACPVCGSQGLIDLGLGTEKVEEELKILLPEASIGRMDLDTAGTQNEMESIILDFERRKTDILIGTQMITKGLDFDHIGLVGIIDADRLIQFPDFRASERAFQMMIQVSGRAGRRKDQGRVIIQTSLVDHPLIRDIINHDYQSFVERELLEREKFNYPPFSRLIDIMLKHKDPKLCRQGAIEFGRMLKTKLGRAVLGPAPPGIERLRGLYHQRILIKLEKDPRIGVGIKRFILEQRDLFYENKMFSPVKMSIDVDPV